MAKRAASKQLTHDNWNDEDDEEETPGVYKPGDASILQNRVIKKARRTFPAMNERTTTSPFSKFTGFGNRPVTAKSVPSLGLLMNICKKSATQAGSAEGHDTKQNGSEVCEKSAPQSLTTTNRETKQNGPESLKPGLDEKMTASLSSLSNSNEPSQTASDSACRGKILGRDDQFYRQLKALNEGVMKWMKTHMERNPLCDFTPVFNDYQKHISTLKQKYPLEEKSSRPVNLLSESSFIIPSDPVLKLHNVPSVAPLKKLHSVVSEDKIHSGKSASKRTKTTSISSPDVTESTGMYGAGFKSSTTNTSTFSFGIKATTTATVPSSNSGPTSSYSSSENDKVKNESCSFSVAKADEPSAAEVKLPGKPDSKPFSFAVSPPAAVVKEPENRQNNGVTDDEDYVPPKNESVNIAEEGAVYTKRCKLFYKSDEVYKEKGVGTLYLKPQNGSTQFLIRSDTVTGLILLNIKLVASLPMQRTGKNNVLLSCVPNPPLNPNKGDSNEAVIFLIRTKTGEDADELFSMMDKYKC